MWEIDSCATGGTHGLKLAQLGGKTSELATLIVIGRSVGSAGVNRKMQ